MSAGKGKRRRQERELTELVEDALLRADLARALELLGALQDKGVDLRRFTGDLLRWLETQV